MHSLEMSLVQHLMCPLSLLATQWSIVSLTPVLCVSLSLVSMCCEQEEWITGNLNLCIAIKTSVSLDSILSVCYHKALHFGSCLREKPLVISGISKSHRLYFPLTRIIF